MTKRVINNWNRKRKLYRHQVHQQRKYHQTTQVHYQQPLSRLCLDKNQSSNHSIDKKTVLVDWNLFILWVKKYNRNMKTLPRLLFLEQIFYPLQNLLLLTRSKYHTHHIHPFRFNPTIVYALKLQNN